MSATAGPWIFIPWHIAEGPSEVRAPDGSLVCTTSTDDDARLIAGAPELLRTARKADCACSPAERASGHDIDCWMPELLEAIARAAS